MIEQRPSNGDFTIILPTLNESQNIIPMLETLNSLYPSAKILVIDDSSTDGTQAKVRDYAHIHNQVSLIERNIEDRGLTASVMDGILLSETPYFVVLDADFQHPPEAIKDIIYALREGNDIVVGVRKNKRKLSFTRKISSWGAHCLASLYLRAKRKRRSRDTMSGFFGGRTEFCKKIVAENYEKFERRGFKILFDILKFSPEWTKVSEIEFEFGERRGGSSKLDAKVVLSIMRQCGVFGKGLAAATSFFLLSMLGRFIAAFILGILTTIVFLTLTNQPWHTLGIFPTVISFLIAVGYVVVANEFFAGRRKRAGLIKGLQIMFTVFTGYLINLGLFYIIASDLLDLQLVPMFIGFSLSAFYDTVGCSIDAG
ncbi:MAG: glycosyltransferase [Methanomassiliicoccales archaeon]|jgi:dolichol-phosphate mannosyltransferase|nr:glycosyltransferase [Methanomassiliicoccales archaeon]